MENNLSEISFKKLWQLFPVFLKEHQVCWEEWYFEEEAFLNNLLSQVERVFHLHLRYTGG